MYSVTRVLCEKGFSLRRSIARAAGGRRALHRSGVRYLATKDDVSLEQLRKRSAEILSDHLGRSPERVGELVAREIHVY